MHHDFSVSVNVAIPLSSQLECALLTIIAAVMLI